VLPIRRIQRRARATSPTALPKLLNCVSALLAQLPAAAPASVEQLPAPGADAPADVPDVPAAGK
jgi:hypothetical protein